MNKCQPEHYLLSKCYILPSLLKLLWVGGGGLTIIDDPTLYHNFNGGSLANDPKLKLCLKLLVILNDLLIIRTTGIFCTTETLMHSAIRKYRSSKL